MESPAYIFVVSKLGHGYSIEKQSQGQTQGPWEHPNFASAMYHLLGLYEVEHMQGRRDGELIMKGLDNMDRLAIRKMHMIMQGMGELEKKLDLPVVTDPTPTMRL